MNDHDDVFGQTILDWIQETVGRDYPALYEQLLIARTTTSTKTSAEKWSTDPIASEEWEDINAI